MEIIHFHLSTSGIMRAIRSSEQSRILEDWRGKEGRFCRDGNILLIVFGFFGRGGRLCEFLECRRLRWLDRFWKRRKVFVKVDVHNRTRTFEPSPSEFEGILRLFPRLANRFTNRTS